MYKKCLIDNIQEIAAPVKTGTGIHLRPVKYHIYKVAFHFFPFNPMALCPRAIGFFALMHLCSCASILILFHRHTKYEWRMVYLCASELAALTIHVFPFLCGGRANPGLRYFLKPSASPDTSAARFGFSYPNFQSVIRYLVRWLPNLPVQLCK